MRSGWIAALVLAAVAAAGACSGGEPKPEAPADPRPVVWGFAENLHRDPPTIDRKLAEMRRIGARMVRFDLDDSPEQRRAVRAARAAGLQVMGVITGGSRDPAEYAARAERLVRLYAPLGVHHYEIWNEPNLVQTWPTADDPDLATTEYMDMVRAAYPRMKAADPDSTILIGALSRREYVGGRPNDWLDAMYEKGLEGNFDAISVHPYTDPALPGEDVPAAYAWLQMAGPWDDGTASMRELMVGHGDGDKTVWITEYSAPTGGALGEPVTEERQAEILARATELAQSYPWLGGFLWYGARDSESGDEQFGVLRSDWSPKPSRDAYAQAIARARGLPAGV
ncbi:MAG TPA: glycosyl hydrolase [Miltoncostaeaceae bacterium]|nr:glycosyl hydrolase [Miltoncostaeaceae bacterium]